MGFETKLKEVQESLMEEKIKGWLLYDFRHSNSLAHTFLEIPSEQLVSRRFFYWIPQKGDPVKIVPLIEPYTLDHLPGVKWLYRGWQELERLLLSLASENVRVAMEYSPYNALPTVSKVDAGMVELIRKTGAEVVSSADILQKYTSTWTPQQVKSHFEAAQILESIVDSAWAFIEHSLQLQIPLNEYQVQQFMLQAMEENGCHTDDWPTCAVNAHTADPHYHPERSRAFPIRSGDFILLDLWCKQKAPWAVYADITRMGVAASRPSQSQQEIFNIVKDARDRTTLFIKEHYENQRVLRGWQVDQFCRDIIHESGYGEYFIHRTGHNIGPEVHGSGANLDNLETHDDRRLLPGTAFSVEPGIYLPNQFGVRLEYDIYLDPAGKVCITGGIQEELVCLQI
jgi:Xaa-Pro dipeptidase